jgi:hypothetical protein
MQGRRVLSPAVFAVYFHHRKRTAAGSPSKASAASRPPWSVAAARLFAEVAYQSKLVNHSPTVNATKTATAMSAADRRITTMRPERSGA